MAMVRGCAAHARLHAIPLRGPSLGFVVVRLCGGVCGWGLGEKDTGMGGPAPSAPLEGVRPPTVARRSQGPWGGDAGNTLAPKLPATKADGVHPTARPRRAACCKWLREGRQARRSAHLTAHHEADVSCEVLFGEGPAIQEQTGVNNPIRDVVALGRHRRTIVKDGTLDNHEPRQSQPLSNQALRNHCGHNCQRVGAKGAGAGDKYTT